MIARLWRGDATVPNAPRYVEHAQRSVFPQLGRIAGHRGAYLLQRMVSDRAEFLVLTFWESTDAVRQFAGDRFETAVVEPEARAVLTDFEELVRHYEVVVDNRPGGTGP